MLYYAFFYSLLSPALLSQAAVQNSPACCPASTSGCSNIKNQYRLLSPLISSFSPLLLSSSLSSNPSSTISSNISSPLRILSTLSCALLLSSSCHLLSSSPSCVIYSHTTEEAATDNYMRYMAFKNEKGMNEHFPRQPPQ